MLYWGPMGLVFYYWFGRTNRTLGRSTSHSKKPMWQATFSGAPHCGAGCALDDFLGDWLAFGTGATVFGSELAGKYLLAFAFTYLIGIIFQYFSVAPMRGLSLEQGLIAAVRIDTLSLAAYEVGMSAWMAWCVHVYPELKPTDWS